MSVSPKLSGNKKAARHIKEMIKTLNIVLELYILYHNSVHTEWLISELLYDCKSIITLTVWDSVVTWWTSSGLTVCLTAATSFHSTHRSHELTASADWLTHLTESERVSERARLLLHVFVFHHTLGVLQVDLALQIVVIVPRVAVWLTNNTMTFTSGERSDFKFSVSSCWIRDVDGFFCGQNVSDLQRSGCISFHFWFNNHFSHEMWILCIETCDKEGLCVGLGGAGSCRLKWLWMFFIVD